MRLLLVEDSTALRESLALALAAEGHAVDAAADGTQALGFLAHYDYDLMVLDLALPGVDGLGVLDGLRAQRRATRVLVLSARDQVSDRVEALNRGADDYLVKPFAFDELLARLKALARRRFDDASPRLVAGALGVDTATCLATGPGGAIALSPKEYALLELLLRERGRVHTRTALFERLYAGSSTASDKVIEVLVSTLRAKLARAGVDGLIETRRGFGYVVV
ncbi:MAG: two-component system response regulator [Lysobacteraceae bacterium SCN 69-123]|jgi:two-component system copper resistance phosphate regulon response regulator CusR|uniref:response regulator transcription factor n=1 Tax=Stenotrophomonas acidaminiphila TaxID=128780 RepID=UPI00086A76CC|nr:response regulator transcription factor [Stenotrophomonas acidaminiphila]MBN8802284.1 response regulator transcription factor [Stenotrophomonas acidaminiphila]MDF9443013.1 response regulator transcription factor [Stenotrophomonas acidaminiphila]ODU47430.1 MAG: two-component system response regulator [Xanthomonadaceae bacterium SCN 69-123]OJY80103.1 MAG: two-component system response regulator [Stenotrophomonas sp. 69-14]